MIDRHERPMADFKHRTERKLKIDAKNHGFHKQMCYEFTDYTENITNTCT